MRRARSHPLLLMRPETAVFAPLRRLLVASGLLGCLLLAHAAHANSLSPTDVRRVVAQAEEAAESLGFARYTIAVTDRVGNVLTVHRRGTASAVTLQSGLPVTGGLEGVSSTATGLDLAALAAITKAITGAYLSSSGNAFSTRTASFIVQNHFAPGVRFTPGGPLFGVQFSQLPCGDLVRTADPGAGLGGGPRRSPLGLAADPGGFPLYKAGVVVGGVGVIAGDNATYTLDLTPRRPSPDSEEQIALAATKGYAAPLAIRANRIKAGGLTLPYATSVAPAVTRLAPVNSAPITVAGYTANVIKPGRTYGTVGSGFIPATTANASTQLAARGAFILENGAGVNRFPPRAAATPAVLTAAHVAEILQQALGVANEARAAIRNPLDSPAQVTVSVVDAGGRILGIARTPDAPVFGTDVSLQKARTAAFFSRTNASASVRAVPATSIAGLSIPGGAGYMAAADTFFGADRFTGWAFTPRAIGNIARPNFPDGIDGKPAGPLSNPVGRWSPFNVGLQLDLVQQRLVTALAVPATSQGSCTAAAMGIDNGIQIFPGGVPIYRGNQLVGAVGVSGDGIDQDDMIAFLGLQRASTGPVVAGAVGQAPPALRADQLGLRYVQCPQSPFVSSSAQNVCAGF